MPVDRAAEEGAAILRGLLTPLVAVGPRAGAAVAEVGERGEKVGRKERPPLPAAVVAEVEGARYLEVCRRRCPWGESPRG